MKIQFDAGLDYQHEAINAVSDLFDGQDICQTNFTVRRRPHWIHWISRWRWGPGPDNSGDQSGGDHR
jgi:hypothetical protein